MKVLLAVLAVVLVAGSAIAQSQTQPTAPSGKGAAGDWHRIHGHVVSTQGSTLTFKADDGRTLTVDMSEVSKSVQGALTANEGATLVGFPGTKPNEFRARYIAQDNAGPAKGSASTGTTGGDEKAWQRIHGTVQSIQGTTLTLKADDGRTLTVDMGRVTQSVQNALTKGEGVLVVGHMHATKNDQMTARYIQQDKTGGAASPKK